MNIRPVKNENDHKKALKRIERLWDAQRGTREGDELEILSILMENYEREHHVIPPPDPIEAIEFRMEQMGLRKTDLKTPARPSVKGR